jgi:hypothetical protein
MPAVATTKQINTDQERWDVRTFFPLLKLSSQPVDPWPGTRRLWIKLTIIYPSPEADNPDNTHHFGSPDKAWRREAIMWATGSISLGAWMECSTRMVDVT